MEKVFGTAANQYNTVKVNGFNALKAKKVRQLECAGGVKVKYKLMSLMKTYPPQPATSPQSSKADN